MNDKIGNSIVKHQLIINELKQVKDLVGKNIDKNVKFCVHTRELFRNWEPCVIKHKNYLEISPDAMYIILDGLIKTEKGRINKLIDMEIDNELKRRTEKK